MATMNNIPPFGCFTIAGNGPAIFQLVPKEDGPCIREVAGFNWPYIHFRDCAVEPIESPNVFGVVDGINKLRVIDIQWHDLGRATEFLADALKISFAEAANRICLHDDDPVIIPSRVELHNRGLIVPDWIGTAPVKDV